MSTPRDFLRALLLAASGFALLWPLAGYPATLWLIAKARGAPQPRLDPEPAELPSLTVLIPTYQEAVNITARLGNLAKCRYPRDRLEILVIDSGSADGTAEATQEYAARQQELHIRLLTEPSRKGKASAINLALRHTTTDLVLVTDAPTRFHPDALALVASNFSDPAVGAVTGQFQVFEERTATQREEGLFWKIRNALRKLESDVDSTPFLSGELCCFRRALIRELNADTIADDMNVALQVRRAGYRTIVDERALFLEPRSPDVRELVVRKTSRAAGGIQELLRSRDMLFRRRYGIFGMLILPSDLFYYLPLRLPALTIMTAALLRRVRLHGLAAVLAVSAPLAALPVRTRILDTAYMLLFNEWLFLRGWISVLSRRLDVLWAQEQRSAVPAAKWDNGHAIPHDQ